MSPYRTGVWEILWVGLDSTERQPLSIDEPTTWTRCDVERLILRVQAVADERDQQIVCALAGPHVDGIERSLDRPLLARMHEARARRDRIVPAPPELVRLQCALTAARIAVLRRLGSRYPGLIPRHFDAVGLGLYEGWVKHPGTDDLASSAQFVVVTNRRLR